MAMEPTTPAVILRHPSAPAPVLQDPNDLTVPTDHRFVSPGYEEMEQLDALNGLSNLIAKFGAERVMRWVRFLANINGEEV